MADDEQVERDEQADAAAPPESGGGEAGEANDDTAVYEVPVEIFAVLGTANVPIAQLLKMGRGAVLELDRKVGDPVDIYVNRQMVARGEVSVIDERLGVTVNETVKYVR
jgi:flagellar motor switch protein FliN/FliY